MRRIALFAGLLAPLAFAAAPAGPLTVTVTGGTVTAVNVPVAVAVRKPWAGDATTATLTDGSGAKIAGQVTVAGVAGPGNGQGAELHFVLPELKAGETKTLTATFGTSGGDPFRWKSGDKLGPTLEHGGKPVLKLVAPVLDDTNPQTRGESFKIYHHVYDPDGTRLITKGLGGKFPHHRGLFYGFNNISIGSVKCDIWHGTKDNHKTTSAYQSLDGEDALEAGPALGRERVTIGWHGPDKKLFAKETRELTAYAVTGGHLIDFVSKLESLTDDVVKLDGDPQHAGFHFRADNEVSDPMVAKQTYYLRPDGKGKLGDTRNWDKVKKGPANLPWNGMSFVLGEQRYTVLYLDRPDNPKEARYSERDYGRFGSYFEYTLTKEKPLIIKYRVWVQNGEMTVEQAAAYASAFAGGVKAQAKP